mgnify:CR=1 FL=1
MKYENMMFVPQAPVPELKPSGEQIKRIARALYPIITEYFCLNDEKDESSSNQLLKESLNP